MAARVLALGAIMAAAVSAAPQADVATPVSSSAAPVYTDACLAKCEAILSDCDAKASIPGNPNHPACISNFSECIGYSPFVNGNFVQPTACAAVVTTVVTSYTTYCPEATTIVHNNKTITANGPTTLTITDCPCTITTKQAPTGTGAPAPPASSAAGDCLSQCNAAHDSCVNAPDANMSLCAAKYADCLGYNPWGSGSYVTPTACAAGGASTTGPVVVPTAAAGRVALPGALAALGALAML